MAHRRHACRAAHAALPSLSRLPGHRERGGRCRGGHRHQPWCSPALAMGASGRWGDGRHSSGIPGGTFVGVYAVHGCGWAGACARARVCACVCVWEEACAVCCKAACCGSGEKTCLLGGRELAMCVAAVVCSGPRLAYMQVAPIVGAVKNFSGWRLRGTPCLHAAHALCRP